MVKVCNCYQVRDHSNGTIWAALRRSCLLTVLFSPKVEVPECHSHTMYPGHLPLDFTVSQHSSPNGHFWSPCLTETIWDCLCVTGSKWEGVNTSGSRCPPMRYIVRYRSACSFPLSWNNGDAFTLHSPKFYNLLDEAFFISTHLFLPFFPYFSLCFIIVPGPEINIRINDFRLHSYLRICF